MVGSTENQGFSGIFRCSNVILSTWLDTFILIIIFGYAKKRLLETCLLTYLSKGTVLRLNSQLHYHLLEAAKYRHYCQALVNLILLSRIGRPSLPHARYLWLKSLIWHEPVTLEDCPSRGQRHYRSPKIQYCWRNQSPYGNYPIAGS